MRRFGASFFYTLFNAYVRCNPQLLFTLLATPVDPHSDYKMKFTILSIPPTHNAFHTFRHRPPYLPHLPAQSVLEIPGERYSKSKASRERTINALDMAYIYLSSTQRLVKLKDFVKVLYDFLS